MYCKKCGKKVPTGSKFCPFCGSDMAENGSSFPSIHTSESKNKEKLEKKFRTVKKIYKAKGYERESIESSQHITLYKIILMCAGFLLLYATALPIEEYFSDGTSVSNGYFTTNVLRPENPVNWLIIPGAVMTFFSIGIIVSSAFRKNQKAVKFSIAGIVCSIFVLLVNVVWHADDGISVGSGIVISMISCLLAAFASIKLYHIEPKKSESKPFAKLEFDIHILLRNGSFSIVGAILILVALPLPVEIVHSDYIFNTSYNLLSYNNLFLSSLFYFLMEFIATGILLSVSSKKMLIIILSAIATMMFLSPISAVSNLGAGPIIGLIGALLALIGGILMTRAKPENSVSSKTP